MKIAHWAYFDADPESKPPFPIRIGITDDGELDEIRIADCAHIPDGVEKLLAALKENGLSRTRRFYFIYPRYAVDDEKESTLHYIAGLVYDHAQKQGFGFERNILPLEDGDLADTVAC